MYCVKGLVKLEFLCSFVGTSDKYSSIQMFMNKKDEQTELTSNFYHAFQVNGHS